MHFFAALVSGGKDSCHALAAATRDGHTPVVLLNLAPGDADAGPAAAPDADSHCFQTVGHDAVAALAAATGLPLLRRRLAGTSLDTSLDYASRGAAGDEVEDLVALLAAAKSRFPTITAVVSGAVASDYQRLRVEHATTRVGLTSLAPLWRVGQGWLLDDMKSRGTRAILVKTAAAGLDGRHVGQELEAIVLLLLRLGTDMGVHPAGEGGEYETLTLDCAAFPRASLAIDHPGTVTPTGGGAFVVTGLCLRAEVKDTWMGGDAGEVVWVDGATAPPAAVPPLLPPPSPAALASTTVRASPDGYQVTAHAPGDAASATADALAAAAAALESVGGPPLASAAAHVRLYLPTLDTATFAAANAGYACIVPQTSPPARACVAAPLEGGVGAMVDVCVPCAHAPRTSLHVQSVSAWAPACIGPYAQAVVTATSLVRCAGQIGLEPATMALVEGGAAAQAQRAWASVDAVCVAVGADAASGALSITLYASEEAGQGGLDAVAAATDAFFEASGEEPADTSSYRDPYLSRPLPPFHLPGLPPCIYIVSPGLPRGAAVEVEPLVWRSGGERHLPPLLQRWDDANAATTTVSIMAPAALCCAAVSTVADFGAGARGVAAALARADLQPTTIAIARCYVARGSAIDAEDATAGAITDAWEAAGLPSPAPPPTWACRVGVDVRAAAGAVFEVVAVGEEGGSDSE